MDGHKTESQITESTNKTGHQNVSAKDVSKTQESCAVPVSVPLVNRDDPREEKESLQFLWVLV